MWFQRGQKAAGGGQTPVPPKDATRREADQYKTGHADQTAKNSKKQ